MNTNVWFAESIQVEANKYETLWEWKDGCLGSFGAAFSHGGVEKYSIHMRKTPLVWTAELIQSEAA